MTYRRRTFTLDDQSERLLRADALAEGVNESELVRRRILLGSQLIEACRRVPGPRTDRFARIAVLPEDAAQPSGSEVMRILVGRPGTDGRSRPPAAEPPKARPAPKLPDDIALHHVARTLTDDEGEDGPAVVTADTTACGRPAADVLATSDPNHIDCPDCRAALAKAIRNAARA